MYIPSLDIYDYTDKMLPDDRSMKQFEDEVELKTPMYQRVYQYLQRISDPLELESFVYIGTLEESIRECLETILK